MEVLGDAERLLQLLLTDRRTDLNKLDALGKTAFKIVVEKNYNNIAKHFLSCQRAAEIDVNLGKRSPLITAILNVRVDVEVEFHKSFHCWMLYKVLDKR